MSVPPKDRASRKGIMPFAVSVAFLLVFTFGSTAVSVHAVPQSAVPAAAPAAQPSSGPSTSVVSQSVQAPGLTRYFALDNSVAQSQAPPVPPSSAGNEVVVAIYNAYVSHTTTSTITNQVTFPEGQFSSITVTFFDQYVSNPFDTSFIVSVNNVQILAGNTLENENTTVTQNVTQYYSLFTGTSTVLATCPQFNAGYASYLTVWFTFHTGPKAQYPNQVLPAFTDIGIPTPANAFPNNVPIPFNVSRSTNVVFPAGIRNAYLNLYEQQNGNDEFWYTLQPPFREFRIFIGGVLVGTVQPYPNIQTGGGDLFLWQPILGIGAELYPPHMIPLNPYISLLTGEKQVTVQVINDENLWIRVAVNFMLNTSTGNTAGKLLANSFDFSNSYNQTPATNPVTESIPITAAYLNDSEHVAEYSHSAGTSRLNGATLNSYTTGSVQFYSQSTVYDPSFNIAEYTPFGFGLVYLQNFSMREYINTTTFDTLTSGSSVVQSSARSNSYYQVSGNVLEYVIPSSPTQLVIGFNVTQTKIVKSLLQVSQSTDRGSSAAVSYGNSYTRVNGTGLFVGVLNNEFTLTSLSYNHAFTQRVQKDVSTAGGQTSIYILEEEAVNNSLTLRNGTLILYRVISVN